MAMKPLTLYCQYCERMTKHEYNVVGKDRWSCIYCDSLYYSRKEPGFLTQPWHGDESGIIANMKAQCSNCGWHGKLEEANYAYDDGLSECPECNHVLDIIIERKEKDN